MKISIEFDKYAKGNLRDVEVVVFAHGKELRLSKEEAEQLVNALAWTSDRYAVSIIAKPKIATSEKVRGECTKDTCR